jgi:hypothetical protein
VPKHLISLLEQELRLIPTDPPDLRQDNPWNLQNLRAELQKELDATRATSDCGPRDELRLMANTYETIERHCLIEGEPPAWMVEIGKIGRKTMDEFAAAHKDDAKIYRAWQESNVEDEVEVSDTHQVRFEVEGTHVNALFGPGAATTRLLARILPIPLPDILVSNFLFTAAIAHPDRYKEWQDLVVHTVNDMIKHIDDTMKAEDDKLKQATTTPQETVPCPKQ